MKKGYEAWIRFYMEFADKLRHIDRKELIERIKKVYASIGMRLPTLERGGDVIDIDPFTIFGLFNKGITNTIVSLYNSVPKSYRKNAVFLMNTVTLNEISRNLGMERDLISSRGDGMFALMDKPIVLCDAMPFISQGSVPILFGDFSKVSIEDCGRDELQEEPYDNNPGSTQCTLTGYMDCMLEELMAVRGIRIV